MRPPTAAALRLATAGGRRRCVLAFSPDDNLAVDQVSVFLATRLFDHIGMFAQGTYNGEDRHFSWDNLNLLRPR